MKYMGSKRAMLRNGLGEVLLREVASHSRFIDLFAGSGAVASFVAARADIEVHAYDLQTYSYVLSGAVLSRTEKADSTKIWSNWRRRASRKLMNCNAHIPEPSGRLSEREVRRLRDWCSLQTGFPITSAYGGHYFSPFQSLWIDALRLTIPLEEPERTLALAALVDAASDCAASPGHTAQPFQPTKSARRFLHDAWSRSIPDKVRTALSRFATVTAKKPGMAYVGDANEAASIVRPGDLVFIDPPYSALHYSRFYHVLESVALGFCGRVEGVGRYPKRELRPRSSYSVKSESSNALRELLAKLSKNGANVVLTFPNHDCSNGLSGESIKKLSADYFDISEVAVKSRLSTLGGTGDDCIESEMRGARRNTDELILIMRARPR